MTGRFLANFISLFIPSKNLRHRLRKWKGFETKYDKLKKELDFIKGILRYSSYPSDCPPTQGIVRSLQLAIVEKFRQFASLCEQNGIEYWLDFGTLLGAVRHKGFVPWDEDFDLAVRYEDREKVLAMLRANNIELDMIKGETGLFRIKVLEVRGYVLHIDVFAYKGISNLPESARDEIDTFMHGMLKKNTIFSVAYQNRVMAKLAEYESTAGGEKAIYVRSVDTCVTNCKRMTIPADVLFPLTTLDFEGVKCKVPGRYAEYLADIYGDFMQWPPSFANNAVASRMSMEARAEIARSMQEKGIL